MRKLRRAEERGRTRAGWLDSRHTFSFGDYNDRSWSGIRALRVMNEDVISPRAGYKQHTHRDVEIVTWVLDGALEQTDAEGNATLLSAGEIQRATAGTGIEHAERNTSTDAPLRYLQMWFVPKERYLEPSVEQRTLAPDDVNGRLHLVVSGSGRDGSLRIAQDVSIYVTRLDAGQEAALVIGTGRSAWVQVVRGTLTLNGDALFEGDGVAVTRETDIVIEATSACEALVIDLA